MENRETSKKEIYYRYLHDNNLEDTCVPPQGNVSFTFIIYTLFVSMSLYIQYIETAF